MTNMTDAPGVTPNTPEENEINNEPIAVHSSSSATQVNSLLFFFITWIVLLLFIIILVTLLINNKYRRRHHQKEQNLEQVDVENAEQSTTIVNILGRGKTKQMTALVILCFGAAIAFALSMVSILSCNFLDLEDSISVAVASKSDNTNRIEVYSLGLWGVGLSSKMSYLSGDRNGECFKTTGLFLLDWQFSFSRVSAILGSLVGGLSLIILVALCFTNTTFRRSIRFLVWPFLVATLFQLLTLFLVGTSYCDFKCEISLGALASITAALYWLFCACVAAMIPFGKVKLST